MTQCTFSARIEFAKYFDISGKPRLHEEHQFVQVLAYEFPIADSNSVSCAHGIGLTEHSMKSKGCALFS